MHLHVIKGKETVPLDVNNDIDDDVYYEMLKLGAEVLINRKMSKLTKASVNNDEGKYKSEAMLIAAKNLEDIKAGDIKFSGKKSEVKVERVVKTEAMRLAKIFVKDEIKAGGGKPSHYKASQITAAAEVVLEQNPDIFETAKANLAAQKAPAKRIDIAGLIKPDAKLVAQDEKRKAEAKAARSSGTLSKTQAGKVQGRAKPTPGVSAR
jgi:hypothetical protein